MSIARAHGPGHSCGEIEAEAGDGTGLISVRCWGRQGSHHGKPPDICRICWGSATIPAMEAAQAGLGLDQLDPFKVDD